MPGDTEAEEKIVVKEESPTGFQGLQKGSTELKPTLPHQVQLDLESIKKYDYVGRLGLRKWIALSLIGLIVFQNVAAYGLVLIALSKGKLPELQIIFGTLTAATLIETSISIKFIVQYLFSDIKYL